MPKTEADDCIVVERLHSGVGARPVTAAVVVVGEQRSLRLQLSGINIHEGALFVNVRIRSY